MALEAAGGETEALTVPDEVFILAEVGDDDDDVDDAMMVTTVPAGMLTRTDSFEQSQVASNPRQQ